MSDSNFRNEILSPLSIGNIVSVGLRLYREHFKTYFVIALKAVAWSLIPVYGWAKYAAFSALISRLAYRELIEQPETPKEAKRQVEPRKWLFLRTSVVIILRCLLPILILSLIFFVVVIVIGFPIFTIIKLPSNTVSQWLGIFWVYGVLYLIIRLYLRYYIAEMPITIEGENKPKNAIERSLKLIAGQIWHIPKVILTGFLISTQAITLFTTLYLSLNHILYVMFSLHSSSGFIFSKYITNGILNSVLTFLLSPLYLNTVIWDTIYTDLIQLRTISDFILDCGQIWFSLIITTLIVPFWQTIKSVVYYDLQVRKEGLLQFLKI